ncbi:MAG: MqnA/MqnD/SBP family protein, partial [Flavisolibacter sp.]
VDAQGEDYREEIKGRSAGVVIGDRALKQRLKSKYIYDLGEAWLKHTGLPFVFAAWIANKDLPAPFVSAFNEANALGLQQMEDVIKENPYDAYDLSRYYHHNISYQLDDQKKKGLKLFLEKLRSQ